MSPTCRRTRWQPGEDCRNDTIQRHREESGICFAQLFLQDGALCWNSKHGLNGGTPTCRALRKRLKDTSDDEIKLAGLEVLVFEEVEKHWILNSRTRVWKS